MDIRRFLILAFALALATVGLMLFVLPKPLAPPQGSQTLPYQFTVADNPGVDLGTDVFRLGQVTPGGSSWRTLTIENTITSIAADNRTVRRAKVYAIGKGARWLVLEPSVVTLPAEVKVTLKVSSSAELGIYRGVIVVEPLPPE
jgi:hypothetical protein